MTVEVAHEWNVNMNSLDLADYNIDEVMKVWGFVVENNKVRYGRIFLNEAACMRSRYNYHCTEAKLSDIQIETISETIFDEAYLDSFGESLVAKSIIPAVLELNLKIKETKLSQEIVRYTLICNELCNGKETDVMSYADMKINGHGLIYWEDKKVNMFFDNCFEKTMRKLQELKMQNIRPVCVKIRKEKNIPIPVANGRRILMELAEQQELWDFYVALQSS